MILVAVSLSAAGAQAASFRPSPPLRASTDARLDCLDASADGRLVWWRDRRRTIRAGDLNATEALGPSGSCPAGRVAADGSAVLGVVSDDDRGVRFALRPAGGRFSAFIDTPLPAGTAFVDVDRLAFNGELVAFGAGIPDPDDSERPARPAVLVGGPGGALQIVALPTRSPLPPGGPLTIETLAGLDRAGRGLALYDGGGGELRAARFDAGGTLEPPQRLAPPNDVSRFDPVRLAVAPDGTAAAAWIGRHRTTVVTGTTDRGFDLSTATTTALDWSVAIAPDGGAVALGGRFRAAGDRLQIATRAPGQPFTPARSYRSDGLEDPPPMAVEGGRYLLAFGPLYSWAGLGRTRAIAGRLGDPPGAPIAVPNASAITEFTVPLLPSGGPATVLTMNQRRVRCPDCLSAHERREIGVYRISAHSPRRPAGVAVTAAPRQRLDDSWAFRVKIVCPRPCAVRIVGGARGSQDPDSGFDLSRTLEAGTTTLRVGFSVPPDRAFRARMHVAVDDATGELRVRRTLVLNP
ncbi:MAG TPA: hypothetical protein VI300_02880 [Solirubrobacter sp.]